MENLENLNWIDLAILGILLSSVLLGAWRGFFSVVFGVLSLLTGFLVAQKYAPSLIPTLSSLLGESALLTPLAYVLTFFIGFSVFGALTFVFRRLFQKINLGGIDTFIGGMFGALRGWLLAVFLTLLLSLANIHQADAWRNAMTVPVIGTSLKVVMRLPFLADYQEWLVYDEKNRPSISLDKERITKQETNAKASMRQRDEEIDSVIKDLVEHSPAGRGSVASQMAMERYESEKIDTPLQILSDMMEYLSCGMRGGGGCEDNLDSLDVSPPALRAATQEVEEETSIKRRNDDLDSVTRKLAEQSAAGQGNAASRTAIERYEANEARARNDGVSPSALSKFKEYLNCEIGGGKSCDSKLGSDGER